MIQDFCAVEHPVVAVTHRAALHRGGVGAGLALREPVGERGLPRRERGEVAGLDVVVRGDDQRHRAELVHRGDQRAARADPGDLLDDDAGRQGVGPHAAVLLGHVRREEVAGHEGVVRLLRVAGLLVDRRRVGGDLVLGHRPDGLTDRLVVLAEPVGVEVRVASWPHVTERYAARPSGSLRVPATSCSAASPRSTVPSETTTDSSLGGTHP